jgi:hypothetical protein
VAQGWEFVYQQQFTFLPGLLRGLAASFNYTWITTHGNRGGTTYQTRREVAGFIPHAVNASLPWRSNVLNEPQEFYIGYKDRLRRHIVNFVTVTVGVNGRF